MGKLILEKKVLDYGRYGLSCNPFPYAGIPREEPVFCANREKELYTIAEVINFSFGRSSSHLALIGSYGNGKTHILRYVKGQVNNQLKGNSDSRQPDARMNSAQKPRARLAEDMEAAKRT